MFDGNIDKELTIGLGTDMSSLINTSRVIYRCPECRKTIECSYRGIRKRKHPTCPECTSRSLWNTPLYREKMIKALNAAEVKKKISASAKKSWKDDSYRRKIENNSRNLSQTAKKKISASAKKSWKDDSYRQKIENNSRNPSKKTRKRLSDSTKKNWQNSDYVQKMQDIHSSEEYISKKTKISKVLWQDPEYRIMMRKIFDSQEYKENMAKATSKKWRDPKYRLKTMAALGAAVKDPKYKNAMSEIIKKLWQDPKYRVKLSEATKILWQNPEYRAKMKAIQESPEYRAKMKAIQESPEYKEKLSVASKAMWQDPEYREKMAIVRSQQPRISSIQKILYSILDDLNIEYEIEKPIGYYVFDCFIPSHSILIECQGDYWHSLKEAIRNDKAKATYIERYFPQYQLKYLWEHEFSAKDRIVGVIKHWLGLDTPELVDFNFNNIEIRKVKHCDVKLLLSKYHYLQNAGSGGLIYGAYFKDEKDENDKNDELIACCVFSPPTRKEIATRLGYDIKEIRELSRFCIHPSYQKKNFGSWFISKCLKCIKNDYKLVVSFCDTTYNHDGALYKACNFTLDGKTKSDYWYVDKDSYVMHKKTLYQRAVMMKMKEREYAEKNGYLKVWGKEKLRFTYGLNK